MLISPKYQKQYNPFGMLLQGRNYTSTSSENYRFGFNTQEQDDEVYGNGNLNTAEFWEYDTRLGRRWNLDPKPNASFSRYICYLDNPLLFLDIKGDTSLFYNGKSGELMSIVFDNLPSKAYIIENPTKDEIINISSLKSDDLHGGVKAILHCVYFSNSTVIYDLNSIRDYFQSTNKKTIASNSNPNRGIYNRKTEKWERAGEEQPEYSEYGAYLTPVDGVLMIDLNSSTTDGLKGSVNRGGIPNGGAKGFAHIHPGTRGAIRDTWFNDVTMYRLGNGPSPCDGISGDRCGSSEPDYNMVIDEKNIYLYQKIGAKDIIIPKDLNQLSK